MNPQNISKNDLNELVKENKVAAKNSDLFFDDFELEKKQKFIEKHKWFKIARIYHVIETILFFVAFILIAVLFSFGLINNQILTTQSEWRNFGFFGLLSVYSLFPLIIVIVNFILVVVFNFIGNMYDDNGEDEKSDAIALKICYLNKWSIILWVSFLCFFGFLLAGLYIIGTRWGDSVFISGFVILILISIGLLVFQVFALTFCFKRIY
ncbi:MAG: hypothetical protein HUJ42_02245 [Malacoplasma sp.]|nr:hypothetical protein [Malacoplasma sp.]